MNVLFSSIARYSVILLLLLVKLSLIYQWNWESQCLQILPILYFHSINLTLWANESNGSSSTYRYVIKVSFSREWRRKPHDYIWNYCSDWLRRSWTCLIANEWQTNEQSCRMKNDIIRVTSFPGERNVSLSFILWVSRGGRSQSTELLWIVKGYRNNFNFCRR